MNFSSPTDVQVIGTQNRALVRVMWVSFFAILTAAGAWVRIPLPFTPVPITLQTLVVLASGVVLGRDGLYSQVLYLILGGIGLPLFANGAGNFPYLFSATGGYLVGFVAASAVAGKWLHPMWDSLSIWGRAWRLVAVQLFIFIPGVLQLGLVLGITPAKAVLLGFVPFLIGDTIKTFVAAAIPARLIRK
ncbi:MAG: biotin transporter BioY [Pseudomonadota bacterium]